MAPKRRTKRLKAAADGPPFVGGLMRLAMRETRSHIENAMHEAGFTDLTPTTFPAFSFPLPDGTRPSDFARYRGMSRQSANHLLAQMEELGYFERRASKRGGRRLIFLTPRGERVAATIYGAMQELHKDWARKVGPTRFAAFMEVLRELAEPDNDLSASSSD